MKSARTLHRACFIIVCSGECVRIVSCVMFRDYKCHISQTAGLVLKAIRRAFIMDSVGLRSRYGVPCPFLQADGRRATHGAWRFREGVRSARCRSVSIRISCVGLSTAFAETEARIAPPNPECDPHTRRPDYFLVTNDTSVAGRRLIY